MNERTMHNRQHAQVVVLFAIALIAMLGMVGVALDGGMLYVQRRTAQNAADAAALAGTRALQQATASPTYAISDGICKYALANAFGVTPSASAYFVNTSGASLGAISLPTGCTPSGSTSNVIPSGSSGVHVDITIGPYNTTVASIIGISQLTAQASATGQVGVLAVPSGDLTPLAGCGPDMLTDGTSPTPNYNILNADNSINTAMIGLDFVLQGSQIAQNSNASCPAWNGTSSAWKGKIKLTGLTPPYMPPMTPQVDTGNGTIDGTIGTICTNIYGASHDPNGVHFVPPDVCLLLIPIAAPPNPPNEANIVTFACFSIYDGGGGTQKWRGVLHATSDCKYGVYPPTWTWGSSTSETQVLLTL